VSTKISFDPFIDPTPVDMSDIFSFQISSYSQNIVCDTKRSAALGVGGLLAGLGSIVASYLIWDKDAPRYFTAYSILASCCTIILLSSGALFLYLRRENLIKEKTINSRSVYHLSKEELRALGDKNPYFRFKY
jgi:hypothetical protein